MTLWTPKGPRDCRSCRSCREGPRSCRDSRSSEPRCQTSPKECIKIGERVQQVTLWTPKGPRDCRSSRSCCGPPRAPETADIHKDREERLQQANSQSPGFSGALPPAGVGGYMTHEKGGGICFTRNNGWALWGLWITTDPDTTENDVAWLLPSNVTIRKILIHGVPYI